MSATYAPLRPPPSPVRPARIVEIGPDAADEMTLWFGPCGAADVLDHIFDFSAWVAAAGDGLLAASAAFVPVAGGVQGAPVPAPVAVQSALVIVRLAPAGAWPVGTVLTLGCTVLTAQGRQRAAAALVTIAPAS